VRRIDQAKTRAALPAQGKPYWREVRRGKAIGYRAGAATWFARKYDARTGKYEYERLGHEADLDWARALAKAEEWWRRMEGGQPRGYDILRAVEDYARTKIEDATPEQAASFWRDLRSLAKHLTGELLGRKVDDTLKTDDLESWRNALPVKASTKRRLFNTLAAALSNANRLHGVGNVSTWRRVKAVNIPKKVRARRFIPTEAEIKALIAKCEPDFATLVRAAVLTAARYGELAALEVQDFDPEKGTLDVLRGKTGEREVLLSSAAVAFFTEQTRGKLPRAPMFTTAEGTPWGKSMQHRRMRKATSIRPFVFYSLRHFAFSRQLQAGIPAALVAKNGGTSEAMLRAHYHKWIHDEGRAVFDRVQSFG
jgi:integrase